MVCSDKLEAGEGRQKSGFRIQKEPAGSLSDLVGFFENGATYSAMREIPFGKLRAGSRFARNDTSPIVILSEAKDLYAHPNFSRKIHNPMNTFRWLIRSLRFHRRLHLALAGGAALATAVLATALLTGDALNRNLLRIAQERTGQVRAAVELRGRFVNAALADRLEKEVGVPVAPVLRLSAAVLSIAEDGTEAQLDRVNAYGVDARFFALGLPVETASGRLDGRHQAVPTGGRIAQGVNPDDKPGRAGPPDPPRQRTVQELLVGTQGAPADVAANRMLLSRSVQEALGTTGTQAVLSLRFEQPSAFPSDMPLGDWRGERVVRRPVQVRGVLADAELGRLSLVANQLPPRNVFAGRAWLGGEAGVGNGANLLLTVASPAKLEAALRTALLPSDAGVTVAAGTGGVWLVQSERVYLDEAYARALDESKLAPVLALHHLADAFVAGGLRGRSPSRAGTNGLEEAVLALETPYGFITALSPTDDPRLGVVPAGMRDDEIVLNAWMAEKLGLGVGDWMTLRWRRFEAGGKLVSDTAEFRVARVLDMAACVSERERLPRFPGLSDVNRCADWSVGMALDPAQLNDPDNEAYWKAYGPTPKAFITLTAGRQMLGTHFGSAMTARISPEYGREDIVAALRRAEPRELGFAVRPVQQEALQAAGQAMDFRQLFTGMSFVLMVSALILTGLLASLSVAHRREEVGVLRAAGFTPQHVMGLWLTESSIPLVAGVAAGVVAGLGGARLLVWGLNRFWSRAVASAQIPFAMELESCVVAGVVALILSLLAVWWGVRRAMRVQVRELLGDQTGEEEDPAGSPWIVGNFSAGMGAALLALVLLGTAEYAAGASAAVVFFGAGLLLVISLLCLARLLVQFLGSAAGQPATGPVRAGVLNVARHRGRSLLVMALLATGSFLTFGTLSMKQDPAANLTQPGSGSGGFDVMVERSIPLPGNKADEALRQALNPRAVVLPFRVHEGDEAGCLNLNRAQQPQLLGVSPEAAIASRAFEWPGPGEPFWPLLRLPLPDGSIPVLAGDRTTLEYGLQAKAGVFEGSVYEYAGEDGRVWRLRIVGTLPVRTGVLQGSLLVDEAVFTRMYPSAPGHSLWLVRSAQPEATMAAGLRQALGRNGGRVTPTRVRLRMLGAVESTYLDMFLVLGGLGVVLGAAGVGLVVLRSTAARRRELAVLRAVGVPARQVLVYLLAEHVYVLLAGLVAGVLPALVAVQPAMRNLGQEMPMGAMATMIAAMVLVGFLCIAAAVRSAARQPLREALRGE